MTLRRTSNARDLRQRSGLAEEKVWALLRAGRVDGHKFRRQHPIGPYIVDFACDRLRLTIEIDGGVHDRDEVVLNDHFRQVRLEQLGWTVVRFKNEEALSKPDRVAQAIRDHARLIDR
jgi:very-short-patch-repair endonuclease